MAGEAIGIGTGLLEGALNQATNQQQYQQEQNLMSIQHGNQQELNQQGHDLQFKMWQKTNYPEQVRMMKAAGLNPALMYKGAGPGGTTGSQGGGAASKGSAPQAWKANPQTMLMGLEMKSLEKDIENQEIQNQLDKIEVDRQLGDNERGKEEIALITTQKEKEEIERDLKKLDKDFFIKNDIAPSEYAIIGAIKSGASDAEQIIRDIVNMSPEERQKALMGEKYEPQNPFELIREWELKTGKTYTGTEEQNNEIKGLKEAFKRTGFELK